VGERTALHRLAPVVQINRLGAGGVGDAFDHVVPADAAYLGF
jgi:hypothetical protein